MVMEEEVVGGMWGCGCGNSIEAGTESFEPHHRVEYHKKMFCTVSRSSARRNLLQEDIRAELKGQRPPTGRGLPVCLFREPFQLTAQKYMSAPCVHPSKTRGATSTPSRSTVTFSLPPSACTDARRLCCPPAPRRASASARTRQHQA